MRGGRWEIPPDTPEAEAPACDRREDLKGDIATTNAKHPFFFLVGAGDETMLTDL